MLADLEVAFVVALSSRDDTFPSKRDQRVASVLEIPTPHSVSSALLLPADCGSLVENAGSATLRQPQSERRGPLASVCLAACPARGVCFQTGLTFCSGELPNLLAVVNPRLGRRGWLVELMFVI